MIWKDVSDEVTLANRKIIHENQVIGEVKYNRWHLKKAGYRFSIVREYDERGLLNRVFIEKLYETKIYMEPVKRTPTPVMEIRGMKIVELENELFVIVEKIESWKRITTNRCRITMDSGEKFEAPYDAKRLKEKLESLSKPSTNPG